MDIHNVLLLYSIKEIFTPDRHKHKLCLNTPGYQDTRYIYNINMYSYRASFNIEMQITVEEFFLKPKCKTSVSKLIYRLSKIIVSNIFQCKLLQFVHNYYSHIYFLSFWVVKGTIVDNNKPSETTPCINIMLNNIEL